MRALKISLVLGLALVAACDKGEGTASANGPNPREAAIAGWKKGGLEVSAMTPATVAFGKDCQSGTVGGVDVLVCEYATPDEAKAAEDPGLQWVGDATGSSQATGKLLIATADRRKKDPSGRTINQLMKLAPK